MRRIVMAVAGLLLMASPAVATASPEQPFQATVRRLTDATRDRMTPAVWRPGCPVSLDDLRRVSVTYWDFSGDRRRGAIVVNKDAAGDVVGAMKRLYGARFPIRRMRPIEAYGGDDFASIEADNTSAFNCRAATGSSHWSQHAYGRALDINPIENPYVEGDRVYHRASRDYVDRADARAGMAVEKGALVSAFDAVGWGWGGRWSGTVKDFQHFSSTGG
jgi:D-alanyl-D-alanine carboxypeptidase